jgi:hypothetical protein
LYKKRDQYKEELSDYFKQEAKKEFKDLMSQMLSNPPPEFMQQLASVMSVQQMTTPQLQIIPVAQPSASTDCTTVPSFVASTGNKVCYPVDDITRPVTCKLVIRYGINNNRTKKVGISIAIPGHKFHGSVIPDDYCRVEVTMVIQGSKDDMLEIPRLEGIETLGQAIKNFILWPQRDVELVDPPTPSSSHTQPSSPPQTLVPLYLSSPPQSFSHATPHPLSNPPSPLQSSTFRTPPPSPQPSKDLRQSKKYKFPLPKLVSTFEKKKSKATTAGTA